MLVLLAQFDTETRFQCFPLWHLDQRWQWMVFGFSILTLVALIVFTYLRDTREHTRPLSLLLIILRLSSLAILIVYFLNLQKHTETRLTRPSRVLALIDTSLSMGVRDQAAESGEPISRIESIVQWLRRTSALADWRREHEVLVYGFGDGDQATPVAFLPRDSSPPAKMAGDRGVETTAERQAKSRLQWSQGIFRLAIGSLLVGLLCLATCCLRLGTTAMRTQGWRWFASHLLFLAGTILAAISFVLASEFDWSVISGLRAPVAEEWRSIGKPTSEVELTPTTTADPPSAKDLEDWLPQLTARGTSTRLGSAIQQLVRDQRAGAVAAIVMLTDGGNNAGMNPEVALATALDAGIPIYTIGMGDSQQPRSIQIRDVEAPARIFPLDRFTIKVLLSGNGVDHVDVDLTSVDIDHAEAALAEGRQTVTLNPDGNLVVATFELEQSEPGKREYSIQLSTDEPDVQLDVEPRRVRVEAVERKFHVMLIAGGPTRDFQLLRNQLYRDRNIISDVWLQSATEGADQESHTLLSEFPKTMQQLDEYDCIIAFDPDWRMLDESQVELLERWVSEKAGGIILVAGPVMTPRWTQLTTRDEAIERIKRLYPVVFYGFESAPLKLGRFGGEQAFPLQFTRSGQSADFLWLADSGEDSEAVWNSFPGVFGYYAVNEPKAGADVLARFSDPTTEINGDLPIYLAVQYYGSGRVFFQASGEIWRLRELSIDYFERYYSQLIQYVAQGRLLRDSRRGILLPERTRVWIGQPVNIRAMLRDPQDEPLVSPEVQATLIGPDGAVSQLPLMAINDPTQPGSFIGQFAAMTDGEFQIRLPIPLSPDGEVLSASIHADIPDLERLTTRRNDALLERLADQSGGRYLIGLPQPMGSAEATTPSGLSIEPNDQEVFVPGGSDWKFRQRLARWLLVVFTVSLCLEWISRRLNRLA